MYADVSQDVVVDGWCIADRRLKTITPPPSSNESSNKVFTSTEKVTPDALEEKTDGPRVQCQPRLHHE